MKIVRKGRMGRENCRMNGKKEKTLTSNSSQFSRIEKCAPEIIWLQFRSLAACIYDYSMGPHGRLGTVLTRHDLSAARRKKWWSTGPVEDGNDSQHRWTAGWPKGLRCRGEIGGWGKLRQRWLCQDKWSIRFLSKDGAVLI